MESNFHLANMNDKMSSDLSPMEKEVIEMETKQDDVQNEILNQLKAINSKLDQIILDRN